MKRTNPVQKWGFIISVTILVALVLTMIHMVTNLQGDARVINYAGRARGSTQRLIKQELIGYRNDDLIEKLDSNLKELLTGNGENNLKKLDDKVYLDKLGRQIEVWDDLKKEIYTTRMDISNSRTLYILSEIYYELADATVDAAENYSSNTASFLRKLEILTIMVSILIIIIIFWQSYDAIYISRLNKRLNEIAYVDVLTGLPNRTSCEEKLLDAGLIKKGQEVCCLMFDLNNLKVTNDRLGHKAGDALLSNFAQILRASAQEEMFIGRYGGDEFIGIIKNVTEEEILSFIDTLEKNIAKHNNSEDIIKISYAYGYAMSSSYEVITLNVLLEQADNEMYQRKAQMKLAMSMA